MRTTLEKRCKNFIENNDVLRKAFKFDEGMILYLCSVMIGDGQADARKIKECQNIIKDKTSIFSSFRQTASLALALMLSQENDPAGRMDDVLDTYSILKEYKFKESDYLAISAFLIKGEDRVGKERVIQKARDIYRLAKGDKPFLTSSEDYVFSVMLALTGMSPESALAEQKRCYNLLKGRYFSKDAVQALSFVLALGRESAEIKCEKALRMADELKQNGCKFKTVFDLPLLGLLTLLAKHESQTISDIINVSDFLKNQKGFGVFGVGKEVRVFFATALAAQENSMDDETLNATLTTTITSVLIAIQIMIIITIVASSASIAASSSSS